MKNGLATIAMIEFLKGIIGAKEFWTTIGGAMVGGGISFLIQLKNLREARANRREDRLRTDQGLSQSLQFKMTKIHSNIHAIHQHIEECFEEVLKKEPKAEPWQLMLPLVNLPETINFAPDEMGMFLGLKHDDVFNAVVDMDVVHNSLVEAVRVMNAERRALTERLQAEMVEGRVVSATLSREQAMDIRPRMIEVNSLIEGIRASAARNDKASREVLRRLNEVLRKELGLTYRVYFTDEQATE
jgi:hypothetical protein